MRRKQIGLKLGIAIVLFLTACSNVLEGTAGKTSDEALLEDAIKLMDAQDYTGSIAKFNAMGTSFSGRADVKERWAGALAGQCGLNFINYTQQLTTASLTGSTLFKYLMNAWTGVTVVPASCTLAETKIKEIWASNTATASQQLFMAILGMVKMGVYLRYKVDKDGVGNLGDNTADAGFNSCTNGASAPQLSDADVTEMITGFSLFLQNIVAFTSSLSSDLSDAVTDINTACGFLTPNPCATSDASGVTAPMINSMRDLLQYPTVGVVETCLQPDPNNCCP